MNNALIFVLFVGASLVGGCGPSKTEIQKQAVHNAISRVSGNWNLSDWEIDKIDL